MSYLVLARKWRPKRFSELVGQEHVVRALSHALDSGRVHHAFLFTGTRGVGKTTIARIFAKSLNCETGVGAEPCGTCAVCTAVDTGRFVDLIEIDAASNTGVDDVREVIENAQYLPTRGRYKVYLVDEVHMLSRNAFNALLKTLEEPPEHVKFLLATTDPQKLPVTVLSRCLQFNLKRLTETQIGEQIARILAAEAIEHDERSVSLLARGADGSLRDGLSLLDQAIAYGSGSLRGEEVAAMLGSVDSAEVDPLIDALVANNPAALYAAADHLAGFGPDFSALLDALAAAFHRIQLRQLVPAAAHDDDTTAICAAAGLPPEQIQLWYQMAVSGRRELALAPSPRVGFEMILLRMLAFAPDDSAGSRSERPAGDARAAAQAAAARLDGPTAPPRQAAAPTAGSMAASDVHAAPVASIPAPVQPRVESAPEGAPAIPITPSRPEPVAAAPYPPAPASTPTPTMERPVVREVTPPPAASALAGGQRQFILDNEDWLQRVAGIGLRGPAGQLAAHAQFVGDDGDVLRLALPDLYEHLKGGSLVDQLANALADSLGGVPKISFVAAQAARETLHQRSARERDQRQVEAEAAFAADPSVQRLVTEYGARIVPDSVRPLDR